MKFCIISDLHCKYQLDYSESSESLLYSNMPRKPFAQHPVAAMLELINKNKEIKSDVLLCLGDLGDKADEQGITSAWTFVEEIRQKLNAKIKIGIPGNHDVNSRKLNGKDAFSYIKNFHESFPTNDMTLNSEFWSNGYCIQTFEENLFLLINTVHNHEDEDKANSSILLPSSIEDIERSLRKWDSIKNKICLLHHHPIKHSNINNFKDIDSLENGDDLISLLNRHNFNIVLHGHKHQPRIIEQSDLPIFATGSFSSFANLQGTGLSTMFHIIEIPEEKKVGTIYSWEYNVKDGWVQNYNKKFPQKIGFGGNIDLEETAKLINEIVQKDNKPKFYSEIVTCFPELEFLIPDKLIKLGDILKSKYKLSMSPEYPLQPNIVTLL